MKIYDLRIEYRTNPIGMSTTHPRFSWKMESEINDTKQKAYHVIVKKQDAQETVVWDSGVIKEETSVLVAYEGADLEPETAYTVFVEVEDNHGNTAFAEGHFETGILDNSQFTAQMLTHNFTAEETACPIFWKEFTLAKPVAKARLYATAQGVYEVSLNGSRVGDYRMAPGWTSYHHRLQYQIYDVTELLTRQNQIEMTVGNGWYKGIFGFYCQPNIYGDRVGAFAELHVVYEDGTTEVIATDSSWGVRTGEIRYSEIYMGETIDTVTPNVEEGTVAVKEFDRTILTAQENEPVRITQRIPAKELIVTPKGEKLEAFRQEYYTSTGRIVSETQTGAVLSLYFNLAREQDRERILKTLLTNIENHKNHLSTGFVGTPYICHALSENGAQEMAATLFMKEDYPSWLYAVNMGATTVWERWNSIKPDGTFDESGMNSLNHYAYGSIGDWMYRKVAGLAQLEPGYKKFQIKPMFVKGIEEAGVEFESVYGKIVSRVSCKAGKIHVHVEVPANTTAVICLPEKDDCLEVDSGVYDYEYETKTSLVYERFSMDSTFGELLEQPLAVDMFNQMVPGMLDNPMLEFARQMTISEMLGNAPDARPLYEAVIHALNVQDRNGENA